MSEQNPNDIDITQLSAASRVRAVADGELDAGHLGEIEGAEARLAFERDLREAVARAMGGSESAAPAELRERIGAMLRASDGGRQRAGVIQTPMGDTRERSFWGGIGRVLAVAAVLVLCATAVIVSSRQVTGPPPGHALQAGLLTSFVHDQHDLCRTDPVYSAAKFTAKDLKSALALARDHLGAVPALIERGFKGLKRIGFRFAGMGRCAVPGEGPSVHVVFKDDDAGGRMVSLFIQVDRHQWVLADSHYALLHDGLEGGQVVVAWRDDQFLYFLIATRDEDLALFRRELGVPSQVGELIPAQ